MIGIFLDFVKAVKHMQHPLFWTLWKDMYGFSSAGVWPLNIFLYFIWKYFPYCYCLHLIGAFVSVEIPCL